MGFIAISMVDPMFHISLIYSIDFLKKVLTTV